MNHVSKLFLGLALMVSLAIVGCGDTKEEEKKEEKAAGITKVDDGVAAKTTTPAAAEMTTVSVKLPNMTWGGCAKKVRAALTGVTEVKIKSLDDKAASGTFEVAKGFDFKAKLEELAKTEDKLADFSIN